MGHSHGSHIARFQSRVFVRIEMPDAAGNIGERITPEPITSHAPHVLSADLAVLRFRLRTHPEINTHLLTVPFSTGFYRRLGPFPMNLATLRT